MRSRVAVALCIALLLLAACSVTRGSGQLATTQRDVTGFTKVELTGQGNVIIEQTGSDSLTISAEDNLLPLLTSDISGDTLVSRDKAQHHDCYHQADHLLPDRQGAGRSRGLWIWHHQRSKTRDDRTQY